VTVAGGRYRVIEHVDDDGAFDRTTTFTVVDTETGAELLTFEGRFRDSMFADQKEYEGVRWVELDADGIHVLVHGYEGAPARVAIPDRVGSRTRDPP